MDNAYFKTQRVLIVVNCILLLWFTEY